MANMNPTTTRTRKVIVVDNSHVARRVGERIRQARTRMGLTQRQLAQGRYTAAYISALERGLAKPSMAALTFLSERLGVSIPDLLAEDRGGLSVAPDFRFRLLTLLGNVETWDGQSERGLTYMEEARSLLGNISIRQRAAFLSGL